MLSNEFVSLGIFLFSFFLFFLLKNGTSQNLHFTRNWPKFSRMARMIWNWLELDPRWNEWYYHSGLHACTRNSDHFDRNGTDLITMVWTFILLLTLISSIYILFFVMCYVLHIPKSKISCSKENEFVWDWKVWWFFCVQPSVFRQQNLIAINLVYNEYLPLLWFYRHLLTL